MKRIYFIILAILIILGIFFTIRVIGGEDDWICKDGKWIKHGNPANKKPSSQCIK